MKKRIFGIAALAFATLFASCSKENDLGNPNANEGNGMLAFSFNKPQGSFVTYADIASAEEWNIAAIDVYAGIDGTVTKLTSDKYTLAENAKTYTITMNNAWILANAAKTANFYFVGNDATSTLGAHTALTQTSEAAFRNALANELTDVGGKASLIVKPNGSTKNLLFSTIIEGVKIEGKVNKNAILTRREARFDVENSLYAGDAFKVTEIRVSSASTSGLVFPCGNPAGVTINKKSHVAIPGIAAADYNAENLATSVFYLYPTEMGTGKTEITVMGSIAGGDAKAYAVDASAVNNKIEANTRYILVLDPVTVSFKLTVADYEEGGRLPAELGADDVVTLENFTPSSAANWHATIDTYEFDNVKTNTIAFDVNTKYGTVSTVEYMYGNQSDLTADVVVNKNSNYTYSGMATIENYTINVPAADLTGFLIRVTIKSISGAGKQVIYFQKGGIPAAAMFSDAEFAAAVSNTNGGYPIDINTLENMPVINANGQNLSSLNGVERFPKFNRLVLEYTTGFTLGAIDEATLAKLETVILPYTIISDLDLSKMPNLKELRLIGASQSTVIDLSPLSKLEEVTLVEMPSVNKIILGNHPNLRNFYSGCLSLNEIENLQNCTALTDIGILGSSLTTIDVTPFPSLISLNVGGFITPESQISSITGLGNCPGLQTLSINNSKISSLDISANTQLIYLVASDLGNLSLTVWSGFPTGNPQSVFTNGYVVTNTTVNWLF